MPVKLVDMVNTVRKDYAMTENPNLSEIEEEMEDTMEGKYLIFRIGEEEYGIAIRHVNYIIGIQKITELPDMPDYVKGVINLRGKVIPVIDVRLRFELNEREYNERTCIVNVNIRDTAVGLIVDSVSEVISIPATQLSPPPKIQKSAGSRFISGLGKVNEEVKIILDIDRLLFEEDLEVLAESLAE
jgi:purine-binding chemotaxis protein CheW